MKKFKMKFNRRTQLFGVLMLMAIAVLTAFIAPLALGGIALAAPLIFGSVEEGTFKELTEDQMKDMDPEDLAKYFNELNKWREKQIADKLEKMKTENSDELKKEIKTLREEVLKGNVEQVKQMNEAIKQQGLAIKKLMVEGAPAQRKTLKELIKGAITKDNIDSIKAGQTIVKFEVAEDILKTDVTRSSVTDHTLAYRLPDVGQLATQRNVLRPLFRTATVGPNSNGVVRYVDQASVTRNADWKAEAAQKPESAITWVEKTLKIEKIADTIPVTMEALDDVDFIEGEIRNLLLTNLELKVDADLFSGSGATPIIKGVYTYADTYVPPASVVNDATIYDLLVKVHEDISGSTQYMPNIALMNITDINKMRLAKDANGNYIMPPFVDRNGAQVSGMTVIASNSVTANTMLVGDFNYATLYTLGSLQVKVGMIDKQFIENMVTLLAEERMGLLVRSVHENAFRKVTDISTAVDTINIPIA